jgi:hypothetical protein
MEREFLAVSDWHWYLDVDSQHEISLEAYKATGGSNPVYVTIDYHTYHCAFTWRKLHRAVNRDTRIDSHLANGVHSDHCAMTLAKGPPSHQKRVPFYHLFTSCDYHQNCESK